MFEKNSNSSMSGLILVIVLFLVAIILIVVLMLYQFYEGYQFVSDRSKRILEVVSAANDGVTELIRRQNKEMYLFNEINYEKINESYGVLKPISVFNNRRLWKVITQIQPNPLINTEMRYKLNLSVQDSYGVSSNDVAVEVERLDLMNYQYYSDSQFNSISEFYVGRVYSPSIDIVKEGVRFWNRVEYVNWINNAGNGKFLSSVNKLAIEYPSLKEVVNFSKLENSTKESGKCGRGIGLYIGEDADAEYAKVINELFRMNDGDYYIDLWRLKCNGANGFVEYNDVDLPRYDSSKEGFNGIIYIDGNLHLGWLEEKFSSLLQNREAKFKNDFHAESNCSITIATKPKANIYIENNLTGLDNKDKLYLIAGGVFYISYPAVNYVKASMLSTGEVMGYSLLFYETRDKNEHFRNRATTNYQFKLIGNMIFAGRSMLDIFSSDERSVKFYFDEGLVNEEHYCYPKIPLWRINPGSYGVLWEQPQKIME